MAAIDHNVVTADAITLAPPTDIEMLPTNDAALTTKSDEPFLVTFDTPFDANNPKDWSASRKWAVTDVLSATGFNRIMVSTIMAPALTTIAREFNMNSAESVMALSIYLLATAFGPLFIGPLSEMYGRQKILHCSNIWFLIWNIVCGFANSKEILIGARFLAGFGASAIYALAGGVLGDVWRPEQRGKSLGIYLLIPVLGAAVGPIIGGFMADRTTWRWMFWSTSIFQAIMILVSFTAFRETFAPLILRRRAEKLRRETGNERYYTMYERIGTDKTVLAQFGRALTRPLRLLAFHPIIQVASIISGFGYGLMYIVLTSFSELWVRQYQFSIELSGLQYITFALGEVVGTQVGGPLMDRYYRHKRAQHPQGELVPESRIPLMFFGELLAPLGLFMYGWTAQYRVHWIAVDIGMFIYGFGAQIGGMPLQAYVIDTYSDHASSATAATQFLRSLAAFLFPLFAPKVYEALGYGWGNSMLAFLSLTLGIAGPLVVWYYGARLRQSATSSY